MMLCLLGSMLTFLANFLAGDYLLWAIGGLTTAICTLWGSLTVVVVQLWRTVRCRVDELKKAIAECERDRRDLWTEVHALKRDRHQRPRFE